MLTTDRETAICEKYSAYDKNNRVHCNECPLIKGDPAQRSNLRLECPFLYIRKDSFGDV